MQTKYDELVAHRDALARIAARALMKGDNAKALRFAARFASVEAEALRHLEEVTR